jgi:hypothetical protein
MFRFIARKFSSDSPFRYGIRRTISPHIYEKDFGRDVLICAHSERLNKEALQILQDTSSIDRPQAFWEIFARRTNESVHLLNGQQIRNILAAFASVAGNSALVAGISRVVCDDIGNRNDLSTRFANVAEAMDAIRLIKKNSMIISEEVLGKFIIFFADNTYQLDTRESVQRLVELLAMTDKGSENRILNLLYRKLAIRWTSMNDEDVSTDISNPSYSELADLVGVNNSS